eukprot:s2315_g11.t1
MGPEEGVPVMAKRMLLIIKNMAEAYEVSAPPSLRILTELLTTVFFLKIMDFLVRDEITDLQKAEIRRAVRVEDFNRASDLGVSAVNSVNHTNDEAEMEVMSAQEVTIVSCRKKVLKFPFMDSCTLTVQPVHLW